jgi:hypothetical protein
MDLVIPSYSGDPRILISRDLLNYEFEKIVMDHNDICLEEEILKKTREMKQKMGSRIGKNFTKSGEDCPFWRGGVSFEPYCPKFNESFKERVRNFFGRICVECGKSEEENGKKLSVHHVSYRKDACCNSEITPLFVPLCHSSHTKTNHNREYWDEWFTHLIYTQFGGQCFLPKTD